MRLGASFFNLPLRWLQAAPPLPAVALRRRVPVLILPYSGYQPDYDEQNYMDIKTPKRFTFGVPSLKEARYSHFQLS